MSDETPIQPTVFTLGEAAKAAGIGKSTLSKAITSGRLSYEGGGKEPYRIQPAELFRVFPPKPSGPQGNGLKGDAVDGEETPKDYRLLEGEVNGLRERLANLSDERARERSQLTDEIDDLRRRLDQEGEERRKLTAILTDQRARPEPAPAAPPPRGFWARLTGRGS